MWHDGLMCFVERLEVDFVKGCASLWLRDGNCTDMRGAIALIENISPDVFRIYTYGGRDRDTVYEKDAGEWVAVTLRPCVSSVF